MASAGKRWARSARGKRFPARVAVQRVCIRSVTASPEAFPKGGSLAGSRCKRYLDAALDWIKARHVDGCVVLAETHMD